MARPARMTNNERAVLDLLEASWNAWCKLVLDGKSEVLLKDPELIDNEDFLFHLHALQRIAGFRMVRRSDPEYFSP
jgi:hypothetical protein